METSALIGFVMFVALGSLMFVAGMCVWWVTNAYDSPVIHAIPVAMLGAVMVALALYLHPFVDSLGMQ